MYEQLHLFLSLSLSLSLSPVKVCHSSSENSHTSSHRTDQHHPQSSPSTSPTLPTHYSSGSKLQVGKEREEERGERERWRKAGGGVWKHGSRVSEGNCILHFLLTLRDVKDHLVILDDSFEQELSYHGDQPGLLLLIDMWHPDLPADQLPSLQQQVTPTLVIGSFQNCTYYFKITFSMIIVSLFSLKYFAFPIKMNR